MTLGKAVQDCGQCHQGAQISQCQLLPEARSSGRAKTDRPALSPSCLQDLGSDNSGTTLSEALESERKAGFEKNVKCKTE